MISVNRDAVELPVGLRYWQTGILVHPNVSGQGLRHSTQGLWASMLS